MKHTLIFHGTGGYPEENWFPWLKHELEAKGYAVAVPQFPNADKPHYQEWAKELEKYQDYIKEDSIIVGHSLGGLFLLRLLETLVKPINAAFFVAAPVGIWPIRHYDSDKAFSNFDFDWDKIRLGAKHFAVFHSNDDPYVSLLNGQKLANELQVELNMVPNAGHFNTESGYTEFSLLLDAILGLK